MFANHDPHAGSDVYMAAFLSNECTFGAILGSFPDLPFNTLVSGYPPHHETQTKFYCRACDYESQFVNSGIAKGLAFFFFIFLG